MNITLRDKAISCLAQFSRENNHLDYQHVANSENGVFHFIIYNVNERIALPRAWFENYQSKVTKYGFLTEETNYLFDHTNHRVLLKTFYSDADHKEIIFVMQYKQKTLSKNFRAGVSVKTVSKWILEQLQTFEINTGYIVTPFAKLPQLIETANQ